MSQTPVENNATQPNVVTFLWHGQSVTVPIPATRPTKPGKPAWLLSAFKPLTYAKKYEEYLVKLDDYMRDTMAFELTRKEVDRPNLKKVAMIGLGVATAIGGGVAVANSFKNDNNSVAIESHDSTVE